MPLYSMIIQMLQGTVMTVELFFITLAVSMPVGLSITYLNASKWAPFKELSGGTPAFLRDWRPLSWFMSFYILLMRGTPLLLQMFFIFYGLPYLPVIGEYLVFDRFGSCVIAFILNYAAYFAEIFRGGLLSVDKGQYDAAKALGISPLFTQIRIVIPQMIKVVLPAVGNEAIILVKDTALITVLAQRELLNVTQRIVNSTSDVMPFALAAVFYLIMSYMVTLVFAALEKKFMWE